MSSITYERNPLGLPRGSVRAILSLVITAMFLAYLVYTPADGKILKVPTYLYCVSIMVFVFFASHRSTINPDGTKEPSPLYLPRGTLRLTILGGTVGIVVWQLIVNREATLSKLTPTAEQMEVWPYLTLSLVGGFAVGWLFSHGPWRKSPWYQDLQAWLSLVAMGVLLIHLLLDLIAKAHNPDWQIWDCVLVGILALYYGARS